MKSTAAAPHAMTVGCSCWMLDVSHSILPGDRRLPESRSKPEADSLKE